MCSDTHICTRTTHFKCCNSTKFSFAKSSSVCNSNGCKGSYLKQLSVRDFVHEQGVKLQICCTTHFTHIHIPQTHTLKQLRKICKTSSPKYSSQDLWCLNFFVHWSHDANEANKYGKIKHSCLSLCMFKIIKHTPQIPFCSLSGCQTCTKGCSKAKNSAPASNTDGVWPKGAIGC